MKKVLLLLILICANPYLSKGSQGPEIAGFSAEPYLMEITTDSAVVAFHLEMESSAVVRITDHNGVKEFASPDKSKSHFVKITGLEAGKTYGYQVIAAEGAVQTAADGSFQIKTAARPGESFTFAVYGDTRPGDTKITRYHEQVIEQVKLNEPAFCLVLGDMVDDGARADLWNEFFGIESGVLRRSAIYPVFGDTDLALGKSGLYKQYFPGFRKGYYRFDWGGTQFFALQAWGTRSGQSRNEFDADSEQAKWFEREMAKEEVQKAPFRVVFLHDPVYISRGRASDLLKRIWVPLFQKYKVDAVFASWHLYERSTSGNITYIISGGAGAELIWLNKDPQYPSQAEARAYHFCRVDVKSDAMTISAVSTNGTILDSITLTPRSGEGQISDRVEAAARRLAKQMIIAPEPNLPEIELIFFSSDCSYCRKLLNSELPRVAKKYRVAMKVSYYDLGVDGTYDLFLNAGQEFGKQGADVPAIFIGRTVLGGEKEITGRLGDEIADFCRNSAAYHSREIKPFQKIHDTATIKENAFNTLTYSIVLGAGLLDGINPCAFTTVIFLISYLGLVGGTRKQMLYTGGMFTLAVFIAYFAIGILFFSLVKMIIRQHVFSVVINSLLLAFVLFLAVFSFIDFIRCLRGRVSDITLQLPKFLRDRIHARIRDFARNKLAVGGASFLLGIVIAGMELTCTGQVYFPIITMISEPKYRVAATTYLFSYNVAFILPLVVVFLLATFGITSQKMGNFFKDKVPAVKLGLCILFLAIGALVAFNLGILR